PCAAFLDPVQALAHLVVEVAARINLLEGNDYEIAPAGVKEHAHLVELELYPVLARVDGALVRGPLREVELARGKVGSVVLEIAVGIEALPVAAPRFQLLRELHAQVPCAVRRDPLDAIDDDHRGQPDLYAPRNRFEVLIGQNDAAVARPRWPAVGVRGCT